MLTAIKNIMASILKPRNLPPGVSLQQIEGFNWEDVLGRARSHLEQVRKQAQEIIENAKVEVEQIKANAREEGRQAAEQDLESMAIKKATTMADQKITQSLQATETLAAQLEEATEQWLRQWQHETIPLAIAIAERLVQRQIDLDPSILLQWLANGISLARAEHALQIRIHPEDRERLGAHLDRFIQSAGQKQQLTLVEDETIQSPGVVIQSDDLRIDSQLTAQLDRLVQEMR